MSPAAPNPNPFDSLDDDRTSLDAVPAPVGSQTVQRRSTVLPKVELVGQKPQLRPFNGLRYEPRHLLGQGGVGTVTQAIDNDIGRLVAVKRLRVDQLGPANLARFVDEIRLVGQLEHPNIVPIHDVGQDESGEFYFIMKYVEGETLEQVIRKLQAGDPDSLRRYGVERRVEIVLEILEAIDYAHARGIIHRDIKPANVMIGPAGEVMVMDWGIAENLADRAAARAHDQALREMSMSTDAAAMGATACHATTSGAVIGTPLYMSPEQARGLDVDGRSDVYSLCVMLHELLGLRHYLAGKSCVQAVLAGVLMDEPSAQSMMAAGIPAELVWLLHDGLVKDPARRIPSVRTMIDRLRRRAEGDFAVQCHLTLIKKVSHRWLHFVDRHPFAVTLGMAGTFLGVAGLSVFGLLRLLHH